MKCFSITSLLCVVTLNAEFKPWEKFETKFEKKEATLQELSTYGFEKNWKKRSHDLEIAVIDTLEQKHPLIIKKEHVPARGLFPRGTEVYFPREDGSFIHGRYFGPDVQHGKVFWATVFDTSNIKYSVPTADLMVQTKTIIALENACKVHIGYGKYKSTSK